MKNGTSHIFYAPRTRQQNGVVENKKQNLGKYCMDHDY